MWCIRAEIFQVERFNRNNITLLRMNKLHYYYNISLFVSYERIL